MPHHTTPHLCMTHVNPHLVDAGKPRLLQMQLRLGLYRYTVNEGRKVHGQPQHLGDGAAPGLQRSHRTRVCEQGERNGRRKSGRHAPGHGGRNVL